MVFAIAFFIAPGVAAAFISEWIRSDKITGWRFMACSIVYAAVIGMIVSLIAVLRGHGPATFDSLFSTNINILKYCAVSIILALVVPSVSLLLQKLIKKIYMPKITTK